MHTYTLGLGLHVLVAGRTTFVCVFDSEGIRTPAGRAQWISSPSPWPLGHAVRNASENEHSSRIVSDTSSSRVFKPSSRRVTHLHVMTCQQPCAQGNHGHRQRGDSNHCGQSPMDFESIPLAARAQCHLHGGLMCTFYVCAHAAMAAPLVPSVAR